MPRRGRTVQGEQKNSQPSVSLLAHPSVSLRAHPSSVSLRAHTPVSLLVQSPHTFSLRALSPQFSLRALSPHLSLIQPSGAEPSLIQSSGNQAALSQPSGTQAQTPLPLCQPQEATGSVKVPAPMPFFTGHHLETVRLLPPRKGKVISEVTMSSKEETTLQAQTETTLIEKGTEPMIVGNTAKHQARIDALVQRQRHGEPDDSPWDGVPHVLTSNRLLLKGQQNQRATRPKIKEEK